MAQRNCRSCFATGAIVMALISAAIGYAWSEMQRFTIASTAHQPLLVALTQMQQQAEKGDTAHLAKGLERMRVCWEAYAFGSGDPPEQFVPRLDLSGPPCPTHKAP